MKMWLGLVALAWGASAVGASNVASLVAALGSDEVAGNEGAAVEELRELWLNRNAETMDHLLAALHDDDLQRRVLAAHCRSGWYGLQQGREFQRQALIDGLGKRTEIDLTPLVWMNLRDYNPNVIEPLLGTLESPLRDLLVMDTSARRSAGMRPTREVISAWVTRMGEEPLPIGEFLERELTSRDPAIQAFASSWLLHLLQRELTPEIARAYIQNFRDDRISRNAGRAMTYLRNKMATLPDTLPRDLQAAIRSDDSQLAQRSWTLLHDMVEAGRCQPSSLYYRAPIDFMTDEDFSGRNRPSDRQMSQRAVEMYMTHRDETRSMLVRALRSRDHRVRHRVTEILIRRGDFEPVIRASIRYLNSRDDARQLEAAWALARCRHTPEISRITQVLLVNMLDDDIRGNAHTAARALIDWGEETVPWIEDFLRSDLHPQVGQFVNRTLLEMQGERTGELGISPLGLPGCDCIETLTGSLRFTNRRVRH